MLCSQVFKNFFLVEEIFESRLSGRFFFQQIIFIQRLSSGIWGVHVASGQIKFSDNLFWFFNGIYGRDADIVFCYSFFYSFFLKTIFRMICKMIPKADSPKFPRNSFKYSQLVPKKYPVKAKKQTSVILPEIQKLNIFVLSSAWFRNDVDCRRIPVMKGSEVLIRGWYWLISRTFLIFFRADYFFISKQMKSFHSIFSG